MDYKILSDNLKVYLSRYQKFGAGQIQKIFSTPHFIAFSVRYPGESIFIYLGRGNHYEGLWWTATRPSSYMRIQDKFLMYMRKYLENGHIQKFVLDEKDRAFGFLYDKNGRSNFFALFYSGRKTYFLNNYFLAESGEYKVFCSWQKKEISGEFNSAQLFELFDSVGRKEISHVGQIEKKKVAEIDEYLATYQDKYLVIKNDSKKRKFLERKRDKIKSDLTLLQKWPQMLEEINSEKIDLSSNHEVVVCGIKIKLRGENNFYKKKDLIYNKIKSFKMAEKALAQREKETENLLAQLLNNEKQFSHDQRVKIINSEWYTHQKKNSENDLEIGSNKKVKMDEYQLEGELKIFVGKDSVSNDYLRNKVANKEDFWFHLEGQTSAHAIVKLLSNTHLLPSHLELIGSILRDSTKIELLTIPLIFTQVKNIKGLKGHSGAVLPKKTKTISVLYLKEWKNKIIKKNI